MYSIILIEASYRTDKTYDSPIKAERSATRLKVLYFSVAFAILMIEVFAANQPYQALTVSACTSGIVDKTPGQAFTVEITFKNTGRTNGTWSVNVAFEGEKWTWTGTPQNLTLKPDKDRTLIWQGEVPTNATIDSVARLIVYYDDSFSALNWWIHVVPAANLAITSSTVK